MVLGTLLFAASLTPSLVPRAPWIQGLLGGFCLACGYGLGVLLMRAWRALELPALPPRAHRLALLLGLVACAAAVVLMLRWATAWQNRLRALMEMPVIDSAGPWTIAALTLATFAVLLALARLFGWIRRQLARPLGRVMASPSAALLALLLTATLFWLVGNGFLAQKLLQSADEIYAALDEVIEDDVPAPQAWNKTGSPQSLIGWQTLGREGRRAIAAPPTAAQIGEATGLVALEPLRVYVGLNSAETPQARAELALRELQRIGAFERANLVIVTPTGSGWVDPESQKALEYVLHGDVASVSVQYSYLLSWLAMLSVPEYGVETAQAVFTTIYDHWRSLPRTQRPRLYLHGLSLGAFNSDQSHDLYQVISDPYQGALWSGPPFNTPTWRSVTAARNPGSPAWLPTFGDGSVVRFTAQKNTLDEAPTPWGAYRVVFLQYASDAVTFFDPQSLWRRPAWMQTPLGPDVSPDMRWIPVVSFLQLAFDLMVAVEPPKGYGHVYAFEHYADAWASLTTPLATSAALSSASGISGTSSPPDWTAESLRLLKQRVADADASGTTEAAAH
ncbi:hypothetical protein D8I35_02145 [Corticibacter populi]|uniref:Alpha/beta-hydrolase family protein n=1 Tax=Corticibacter populi TaxID=1550736 RepID=A0A3M6R266_9BURK|nr:hypothetical protein D8I35_02145 [Corticibacter populi]